VTTPGPALGSGPVAGPEVPEGSGVPVGSESSGDLGSAAGTEAPGAPEAPEAPEGLGPSGAAEPAGESDQTDEDPAYLSTGRIARAHGIDGEVQVDVLTDFPEERFAPGAIVHIGQPDDGTLAEAEILSVREHRHRLIVAFDIASDRAAAERLAGSYVLVAAAEALELGEDEYYAHELVGLRVVSVAGEALGEVVGIMETGAADLLRVRAEREGGGQREWLVPMNREIVVDIDLTEGVITIEPLPGLLD